VLHELNRLSREFVSCHDQIDTGWPAQQIQNDSRGPAGFAASRRHPHHDEIRRAADGKPAGEKISATANGTKGAATLSGVLVGANSVLIRWVTK
jgi:hypothetical protein